MIIRLATLSVGYGLLLFGIVGLILPVLHGAIFAIAGLALLSRHAVWARNLLERLKRWHPRMRVMIDRGERLTERWLRRAIVKVGRWFKPARSM